MIATEPNVFVIPSQPVGDHDAARADELFARLQRSPALGQYCQQQKREAWRIAYAAAKQATALNGFYCPALGHRTGMARTTALERVLNAAVDRKILIEQPREATRTRRAFQLHKKFRG